MRPLNRPMFRNGGPIKEGIMSGMKDNPQQLVQPAADGSRPGYAGPLAALGFLAPIAARFGIGTAARAATGQVAKKAAQKTVPVSGSGGNFFKNIFMTQKPAPYSPVRIGQSKGAKELGMKPKVLKGPNVKDTVPKENIAQVSELRPYFANDPTIALVRGTYNALTNPQAKGLFAKGARFVLSPTGVLTGGYFLGGKFFDSEGNEISTDKAEELGLTAGDKIDEKVITGDSDQGTRKLTRDEEIEANRNRYYKMMGVDKLQKEAAYNTLIDASNQIREGGNIKDQLKSGDLVSNVINSLSKNLDKSVDLKRQIDAAILKSEITKDVNREKDQLDAQVKRKQLEVYDKKLKGNDLSEIASLYAKDGRSLKGQNLYAEATRQGIDIKGIFDTKAVDDFMSDNTTKTEADYINEEQKRRIRNNEDLLPPGDYVVGGRIVTVSEGGLVSDFVF